MLWSGCGVLGVWVGGGEGVVGFRGLGGVGGEGVGVEGWGSGWCG